MEYIDLITSIFFGIIAIVVIVYLVFFKKKNVKLKGINIGPFSAEIDKKEVAVERIEIMSMPIAGCAGELLSPPLKAVLLDTNNFPVKDKKVRIELVDENGVISSKNYLGRSSMVSDINGIVEFKDIVIKKTGRICIFILVDELEEKTEDIDVLPPGLNLDFWNETVGSPQYEEKLDRALRMSGSNRG